MFKSTFFGCSLFLFYDIRFLSYLSSYLKNKLLLFKLENKLNGDIGRSLNISNQSVTVLSYKLAC